VILGIVQARMGSTRLPGKVLLEIAGRPLLWHVLHRLKAATLLDRILLATSNHPADASLLALARESGIDAVAGDPEDVLDRFYRAALPHRPDVVVRVTGDCPLLDPVVIDQLVQVFLGQRPTVDYAVTAPSYPDGMDCEAFTFETLARAWREARLQSEREHVTPYIWKNPSLFHIHRMEYGRDCSSVRLTVDEPEDLTVVRAVYGSLYREGEVFHLEEILDWLNRNETVQALNRSITRNEGYQKSLANDRVFPAR